MSQNINDDNEFPEEEETLRDVIVEQSKDITILKRLSKDLLMSIKIAGSQADSIIRFVVSAIHKYPDLQATPEFLAIPKELKELIRVAGSGVLDVGSIPRQKGGGGSENIQ